MANIINLLGDLDDDAPDPLDTLKPLIRFDWNAAPAAAWLEGHPAGRDSWPVELLSGRSIGLDEFHQFNLYAGMLAGIPADTARFAADAVKEANRLIPQQLPMLMLQPMFREFDSPKHPGNSGNKIRVLPPVASVAVFVSSTLESAPDNSYSSIKVIWFQEAYGLPSDPYILGQLRAIDWEREALSWNP